MDYISSRKQLTLGDTGAIERTSEVLLQRWGGKLADVGMNTYYYIVTW